MWVVSKSHPEISVLPANSFSIHVHGHLHIVAILCIYTSAGQPSGVTVITANAASNSCADSYSVCVFPIPTDPSLTLSNMTSALDNLPDTLWYEFGSYVDVPRSKRNKIRSQFHSDGARKREVFRIYLTEHPQPTWELVSDVLYKLGRISHGGEQCHCALDRLQSMFPTGECLHVSLSFLLYHPPPPPPPFPCQLSNILLCKRQSKGLVCVGKQLCVCVCMCQSCSGISRCDA